MGFVISGLPFGPRKDRGLARRHDCTTSPRQPRACTGQAGKITLSESHQVQINRNAACLNVISLEKRVFTRDSRNLVCQTTLERHRPVGLVSWAKHKCPVSSGKPGEAPRTSSRLPRLQSMTKVARTQGPRSSLRRSEPRARCSLAPPKARGPGPGPQGLANQADGHEVQPWPHYHDAWVLPPPGLWLCSFQTSEHLAVLQVVQEASCRAPACADR